jgi:hypothetical protein
MAWQQHSTARRSAAQRRTGKQDTNNGFTCHLKSNCAHLQLT